MKLSSFLLPAIPGLAAAADIEAYLFRSSQPAAQTQSSGASTISAHGAEAVVLHRLGVDSQGGSLDEDAVAGIVGFGKPIKPLFQNVDEAKDPYQLVIALKGASDKTLAALRGQFQTMPGFTTNEPKYLPSAYLPSSLIMSSSGGKCKLSNAIKPGDAACWKGRNGYFEVEPEDSNYNKLIESLRTSARERKMETLLLVAPASASLSSRSEYTKQRRAVTTKQEHVIDEEDPKTEIIESNPPTPDTKPNVFEATTPRRARIPPIFASRNSCETATAFCSGHGQCANRYSKESKLQAWSCRCKATFELDHGNKGAKTMYNWGGNACEKIDISVPFWLIVGFSVTMIAVVAGSISLLFSVGEEKLPGVIGAGVSRGK